MNNNIFQKKFSEKSGIGLHFLKMILIFSFMGSRWILISVSTLNLL